MRTWRLVTIAASAALIVCLLIVLSLPFRFPGYTYSLQPILLFLLSPTFLCVLLAARLRVHHHTFRYFVAAVGLVFLGLTLVSAMAPVILVVCLVALASMYLASASLQSPPPALSSSG